MADEKLTELTEETAPISSDLLYMVDDPGVSPASRKTTFANAAKGLAGTIVQTATQATRPASATTGYLYLPSDGYTIDRDSGSAWISWGPIFPCTPPVLGDFTWVNQDGVGTAVTTYGGIHISSPANAAIEYRMLKKAAPSTPYTITAMMIGAIAVGQNYCGFGIGWRQSGDGKLVLALIRNNTSQTLDSEVMVMKCADEHTDIAIYTQHGFVISGTVFLRLVDDGTDRKVEYGWDGHNFITLHSVGRTDFMTADEVLFFACSRNATFPAGMTLLSWKEE